MKKGMLFTKPLADAIHEGRKSVTRRIMKPQPSPEFLARGVVDIVPQWPEQDGVRWFMADGLSELIKPPYRPGDIVSIKEPHWRWGIYVPWRNKAGNLSRRFVNNHYPPDKVHIRFDEPEHKAANVRCIGYHKRSPLFLPYDLARTHVEILSVRPEELQKITEEDVLAEGVSWAEPLCWDRDGCNGNGDCGAHQEYATAINAFSTLWDSINGKKHPWANNDWVWRYSFRKVENDAKI